MWLVPVIVGVALFLSQVAPFPFLLELGNDDVALWEADETEDVPPGRPIVYLTFDDGPNPTATPALLDVLARHRVRATFFIIDDHLTAETAPIVARAAREGHGIALHSDTRALADASGDELVATLDAAERYIEALAGVDVCPAFRPHAGARSRSMVTALRRSGRRLVGWGLLMWDWDWFRRKQPDRLVKRIAARATAGSIIVLHDGHHKDPRAKRAYVVETVDKLIPRLRADGFVFGTICESIADDPA